MKTVTVTAEYKAAYVTSLILTPGERVTIKKKDSEWPDWYWCTNDRGESAWVFKAFLSEIHNGEAEAVRDYNSRELSVSVGDQLNVDFELGGWLWGVDARNERGWVPAEHTDWHE